MANTTGPQLVISTRDVPRRNRSGTARFPRQDRSPSPMPHPAIPATNPDATSQVRQNEGNDNQTESHRRSRDESDLLGSRNSFTFVDGKDWVTFNGDGNANMPPRLKTPKPVSTALTVVTSSNSPYADIPPPTPSPNEHSNLALVESSQRGTRGTEENDRDDTDSGRGPGGTTRVSDTGSHENGEHNTVTSEWGWNDPKPSPSAPPASLSDDGALSSDSSSRNATTRVAVSRRHGGVPRPPPARSNDAPNRPKSTRHSSANISSNSSGNNSSTTPPSSNVVLSAPPTGNASTRRGNSLTLGTEDAIAGAVASSRRSRSLTPNTNLLVRRCRSQSLTRSANPPSQDQSNIKRSRSSSRQRSRTSRTRPEGSRRGRSTSRSRAPPETGGQTRSSSRARSSGRARSSSRARSPSRTRSANTHYPLPMTDVQNLPHTHSQSFGTPRANAVITSRSASNISEFGRDCAIPAIDQSNSFDTLTARLAQTGRAHENDNTAARLRSGSVGHSRKEGGLMERLFGDVVPSDARQHPSLARQPSTPSVTSTSADSFGIDNIQPRTLLTASVYHNEATHLWIATINTNQKGLNATNKSNASKYLKAFSFHTEREARESAYANAPPKMTPFAESPHCALCNGKFAVFRRPSHCRNCGVCICASCSKTWSHKSIPETYNMKNEKNVKVCKTCHFLSYKFRQTLLDGHYEDAVSLFHTGNINLRCQFYSTDGEASYPVHCAAEGGNIQLLQWLVDIHFCPIKQAGSGSKGKKSRKASTALIQTSKGRTVLDIAMTNQRVDILRYLVVDKGICIYDNVKDLKTSLGALEAVLNVLPAPGDFDYYLNERNRSGRGSSNEEERIIMAEAMGHESLAIVPSPSSSRLTQFALDLRSEEQKTEEDESKLASTSVDSTTVPDACILCYENTIDCVITPCGHQICCLKCSENLSTCPVCNAECQFIKVFKP